MHLLEVRCLFLSSLMTIVGLTCSTRAGPRMPLAFIAISTDLLLHGRRWTSRGIGQEKRAPTLRARAASVALLAFRGCAMAHNIRALTVRTMHHLGAHGTPHPKLVTFIRQQRIPDQQI